MLSVLRRCASTAIVITAAMVLTAILLSVVAIGFSVAKSGSTSTGIDEIIALLRTYIFRNSLRNTVAVLVIALPLACLLGLAVETLLVQNERSRGVMSWLLLLPLAMPLALAMPAWRQVFAASPALAGGVWPALLAIGVIQAWRLLPFATLFLLLARPVQRRRTAIVPTLCLGAIMVVADVGVTLLLTGGEPFNATHLLVSWAYQTAVAGAMPGQAAVLAMVLVPILAGLAWGFVYFAGELNAALQERFVRLQPGIIASTRPRPQQTKPRRRRGFVTSADHTPQAMGGVLLASPVIILLLLPLAVPLVMTSDMMRWPWALGQLFGRLDYGFWLANTILLAGAATLVTVVVALPVGHKLGQWQSVWSARLSSLLGILGMTALPVAFVSLAWLQGQQPIGDGRWLLVVIYSAAAICIGTWLVALVSRGGSRIPRPALMSWLILLCYLLVTNEMAGALALSNGISRTQSLNSGLATRLAFDASQTSPVIGLAILLPMMLLTIFYWWLARSSIAPLLDLSQRQK